MADTQNKEYVASIWYGSEKDARAFGLGSKEYASYQFSKRATDEFLRELNRVILPEDGLPKEWLNSLEDKYGPYRADYVFASIVKNHEAHEWKKNYYSDKVFEWAHEIKTSDDPETLKKIDIEEHWDYCAGRINEMCEYLIDKENGKKEVKNFDLGNMTESELKIFAGLVESSKNFETYNVYDYSEAKGWGMTLADEYLWGMRHKNGTEEQRKWIENFFEDVNFHAENEYLRKRDYDGFFSEAEKMEARERPAEAAFNVSGAAVIRQSDDNTYLKMPYDGVNDDYVYRVPNGNISIKCISENPGHDGKYEMSDKLKEGLTCYFAKITLPSDTEIELRHPEKGIKHLPVEVLERKVLNKAAPDYEKPRATTATESKTQNDAKSR